MLKIHDPEKDSKFRKVMRILVYPNITWMKDLTQDSFVRDILLDIECLNQLRDDLWFYVIMPTHFEPLDKFPNVTQLILPLPSHPPQMRMHFDTEAFKKLVGPSIDIDLVFSHLPEHTAQVLATLYNNTHHKPLCIGYSHWFDFRRQITWNKGAMSQNILGLLEMETCFVNTQAQKDLVLEEAEELFNFKTVDRLDEIMRVCYLGVEPHMFVGRPQKSTKKIIAFNHRPWKYKDFDGFIRIMDALWAKRKDFIAWVPLLTEKLDRPYISTEREPKPGYYRRLSECRVAFAPKQLYAGWSNSATDAMSNGCPVVFFDANYYRELYPEGDFFTSDDECLALLNRHLDDDGWRTKRAKQSVEHIRKNLMHLDSLRGVSLIIDETLAQTRAVKSDSTALPKLLAVIKKFGTITKKHLLKEIGWGPTIMWTPYRTALLRHPNVMEHYGPDPLYSWVSDSVAIKKEKLRKKRNVASEFPHTLGPKTVFED